MQLCKENVRKLSFYMSEDETASNPVPWKWMDDYFSIMHAVIPYEMKANKVNYKHRSYNPVPCCKHSDLHGDTG